MDDTTDELAHLHAEVARLRREVAELRSVDTGPSRRGLLRLAGAAALGAAASVAGRTPVAADNGIVNTNQGATTTLTHSSATGFHFKSSDSPYATNSEVIQVSAGATSRHCIRAFSNNITSTMFLRNEGIGSALLATSNSIGATATFYNAVGSTLNIGLSTGKVEPSLRTGESQFVGSIDIDGQGNLWLCTVSGAGAEPGRWQKLGGLSTAGAFHAISPFRAYDSRKATYTPTGLRAANTSFAVGVQNAHDITTGAVLLTDVVPTGATAVAFNITAVGTTDRNFLAVAPGDATTYTASTLNWLGANAVTANASISKIDADRQLKVFIGSQPGSTHVVIDVQGYWR